MLLCKSLEELAVGPSSYPTGFGAVGFPASYLYAPNTEGSCNLGLGKAGSAP